MPEKRFTRYMRKTTSFSTDSRDKERRGKAGRIENRKNK